MCVDLARLDGGVASNVIRRRRASPCRCARRTAQAHGPDEWVTLDALARARDAFRAIFAGA